MITEKPNSLRFVIMTTKDLIYDHYVIMITDGRDDDSCRVAGKRKGILRDTGRLPRNHMERFRILEERYPGLYDVVDFHFNYYRSSYMKRIEKGWRC